MEIKTMTNNDFLIALSEQKKQLQTISDELFSLFESYRVEDSYKIVESLDDVITNIEEITGD